MHLVKVIGAIALAVQVHAQVHAIDATYTDRVLPTLDGEPTSLGQYRGSKILLMDFAS